MNCECTFNEYLPLPPVKEQTKKQLSSVKDFILKCECRLNSKYINWFHFCWSLFVVNIKKYFTLQHIIFKWLLNCKITRLCVHCCVQRVFFVIHSFIHSIAVVIGMTRYTFGFRFFFFFHLRSSFFSLFTQNEGKWMSAKKMRCTYANIKM